MSHGYPHCTVDGEVLISSRGIWGNQAVALLRMKIGREIWNAVLVAEGPHAPVDGLTSLAVLFGAIGAWLGYPL
mgnify:FL=1